MEQGLGDRKVLIDQINFLQQDPPTATNGFGGYIQVRMRTVDG